MKREASLLLLLLWGFIISAQQANNNSILLPAYGPEALFDDKEILEICLTGDIRKLFKDTHENAIYHPIRLSYLNADRDSVHLNIKVKTRGHFRKLRENCSKPPLLLNLKRPNHSIFQGQNKLKLVTACIDDKYVYREYLIYKIYQLISPKSFQIRLVKVSYNDSIRGKKSPSEYGIIMEDHKQMALRNNSKLIRRMHLNPLKTKREDFLKMAVFQFLIGNTDWSIQYLHNIKLISSDTDYLIIPIPYDFDHAGLVNTPYAFPAEALRMNSVRDRRYRGYCIEDMKEFDSSISLYNSLKQDIYQTYQNNPLLEKSYINQTIKYLDEFYEIINNRKKCARAFQYPCNKHGTGHIVIKGLKNE